MLVKINNNNNNNKIHLYLSGHKIHVLVKLGRV